MSLIKVYYHKKASTELIAEFRSASLLGLCKSAIHKEAKLRNVRVAFREYRQIEVESKLNENEKETEIVGKA